MQGRAGRRSGRLSKRYPFSDNAHNHSGQHFTGIASPTEGAAIALVYSVIITTLVYKSLTFKQVLVILRDTIIRVAPIMSIVACAAAFSHVMSREQIPQMLQNAVLSITENKFIILLLINIICLCLAASWKALQ